MNRWTWLLCGSLLVLHEQAIAVAPPVLYRDQDGRLLPPGVTARLGTVRRRGVSTAGPLAVQSKGIISLRDTATGKRPKTQPGLAEAPIHLTFSPDGRTITTFSETDGVMRWEAATGRQVSHLPAARVGRLLRDRWVLRSNGKHLVHARWRTVELLDLTTPEVLREWRVGAQAEGPLVLSGDGRTLAMAGADGLIRFWDLSKGIRLGETEIGNTPSNQRPWLLFSPDGRTLAVGNADRDVALHDVRAGGKLTTIHARTATLGFDAESWQGCFSPDGRKLYCSLETGVQVWDVHKKVEGRPFALDSVGVRRQPGAMAISADGRFLARSRQGVLVVCETASGQIVYRLTGAHGLVAFAPAGWKLAVVDRLRLCVNIFDLRLLILSAPPQKPSTLADLWTELAHTDAARAQRAAWRMSTTRGVERFLAGKAGPLARPTTERLEGWVRDLGADSFSKRQQAEQSLDEAQETASDVLERAVARTKDLEVHYRLRRLVDQLDTASPHYLRTIRAIMVLEVCGTPEAKRLLQRLTGGAPEARVTAEARAALRRLSARTD